MKLQSKLHYAITLLAVSAAFAQQPAPTVPLTNTPCNDGPKMVGGKPEVASTEVDKDGFVSLFNGTDLKGWWENCSRHAGADRTNGGIWVADPTQKIIYSVQNTNGAGGMFSTNQSFDHYELIFDFWPTFGNDGGVFNRNTAGGKNWQTTLDYIQGSGVGGSFNENGWQPGANINDDPFRFNAAPENPTITSWTTFTSTQAPAGFGCSAGGCTAADFTKVWTTTGWNQMRVKFYDGLTAGRSVTMETWMRKLQDPALPWVPVYKNTKAVVTPPNPIALQIHEGTGRWKSGSLNLYRNIKIRALDINGNPLTTTLPGVHPAAAPAVMSSFRMVGGMLTGEVRSADEIVVRDVSGKVLESFHVAAGKFQHVFAAQAKGLLIVELRSKHGADRMRVSRI